MIELSIELLHLTVQAHGPFAYCIQCLEKLSNSFFAGKSMSSIPNIQLLTPFELALLKKKPIIALDGKLRLRELNELIAFINLSISL